MDNKVMYSLSYGLFVLSARQGDKDNGCITNTAIQVTTDPNRIVVAINKSNYTHDMVKETGRFTVSILSEEAKFDLFQRFGFQSGRDVDKFAGFEAHTARDKDGICYVTQGTNAWLSCKVVSATDLGTHTLFLADVLDGGVLSGAPQRHLCLLPGPHQAQARRPRRAQREKALGVQGVRLCLRGGRAARRLYLPPVQAPRF